MDEKEFPLSEIAEITDDWLRDHGFDPRDTETNIHIVFSMIWNDWENMLTDYFTADIHLDALDEAVCKDEEDDDEKDDGK